jgi:hypothetical protein
VRVNAWARCGGLVGYRIGVDIGGTLAGEPVLEESRFEAT